MPQEEYLSSVREQFSQTWARRYRLLDERSNDDAFEHYGNLLSEISSSFHRPIDILDIGCGTGRYFHRLRNARRLVGLDLSPYMLEQARRPVHGQSVHVECVELICGEVNSTEFPDESFDFIYSIGALGEYSPLDENVLLKCHHMLKPRGIMFVTAVDALSRISLPENATPSLSRRVLRKMWPLLPQVVRVACNNRISPHYVTRRRLERLWTESEGWTSDFAYYDHRSGWLGRHFDCTAVKK